MKILFDHQIFYSQVYGGVSRYFFELMRHFREDGNPSFDLALKHSKNYYVNQAYNDGMQLYKKPILPPLLIKAKKQNLYKSSKMISRRDYDLFHPTYYDPYFLDFIKDKPFVLTIYDMIHEVFAAQFPENDKTVEHKKKLAHKAKKIIAISESTKRDILKFYKDVNEEKIVTTHLASCLEKDVEKKPDIEIPSRYILFVGARRTYHKNFQFFINAVQTLLSSNRDLHIICAGARAFSPSEMELFEKYGIENQLHHIAAEDATLVWLYKNALAFIFPTLYEGFGIPVLEAFGCDCPVVCSNTSSLPEVGGQAAVYFDPEDEKSLNDAIEKVIYDEDLRQNMIAAGRKRIKEFSWKKTAQETFQIYKDIL